jgi:hypothetical protein
MGENPHVWEIILYTYGRGSLIHVWKRILYTYGRLGRGSSTRMGEDPLHTRGRILSPVEEDPSESFVL